MDKITKWREAKTNLSSAEYFLSLIGKPQHTTAKDFGHIHSVTVTTKIYYQESDGSKNYHENLVFDNAFSQVIREQFNTLSALAMDKMKEDVRLKAIEAREEVQSMQSEIDKAEEVRS